jgi:L-methionine (R)-S-oxide reductase
MDQNKKAGRYQRNFKQLQNLLTKSTDPVSRMATIAAVLYHKMDYFFWCGFYLLDDGKLTVGPYQGPLACQLLEKDTGVCWAGLNAGKTIIVPDVEKFPGHIACDSRSKSEIVIPLFNKTGNAYGVLDVDSTMLNAFDDIDRVWLEKIMGLL